jgi:TetR/AcrR family transcriptional repressor of mexJK operon
MFMKHGFDGTSIDAVAEAALMSKRTVYARYRDKNELFSAVLRDLIDRWLVPINQFQLGTYELEPMLMEIGRHLLGSALTPQVVSLHRIILGESERRPAFGRLANAEGRQPAVRAIAAALRRQASQRSALVRSRTRSKNVSARRWISFCTGCAAANTNGRWR